jgi:uncharacterized membrane protein
MAITLMTWLLAFPILGFANGLRTLTPIAVLCWFAYLKYLPLDGTWGFWAANLISAMVFTVLALGEWVGDTLPGIPNRTTPAPLLARLGFGGLVGGLAAAGGHGPALEGIMLGVLGAAAGTYVGFMFRRHFTQLCWRDLPVALSEDAIALLLSGLALHMISS